MKPLSRHTKIGILGGGKLGRMLAMAAHNLGFQTVVFCQNRFEPAALISTETVVGQWTDRRALLQFATSDIEAVICEWENAPVSALLILSSHVPVHSIPTVLGTGRSRTAEKTLADLLDIETTKWAVAADTFWNVEQEKIWSTLGPYILKTNNGVYDGKGQFGFADWESMSTKFLNMQQDSETPCIIERKINLAAEYSVMVVRNAAGEIHVSPAVFNKHTDRYGGGILQYTCWWPDKVSPVAEKKMQDAARAMAEKLQLVGVMCLEFFHEADSDDLFFNGVAPRVHNSFHGTIEAANQSQFYWHIAAASGLPLEPMEFHGPWIMLNLIDDQIELRDILLKRGFHFHDYQKATWTKGRKMGHATMLLKTNEPAEEVERLLQLVT